MMKAAILNFAHMAMLATTMVMLPPVQAAAGSVRAATASTKQQLHTKHEYAGVTIYINHVSTAGSFDKKAMTTAFMNAYNAIHHDITITDTFVDRSIMVPESHDRLQQEETAPLVISAIDGHVAARNKETLLGVGGDHYEAISWCTFEYDVSPGAEDPADKDIVPPYIFAALDSAAHDKLENNVCGYLKLTNMAAFAEVTTCQVEFTYEVTQRQSILDALEGGDEKEEELIIEFDLEHVIVGDYDGSPSSVASTEDAAIGAIAPCMAKAYNRVHEDRGDQITDSKLTMLWDIPEEDEDEDMLGGKKRRASKWRGRVTNINPTCGNLCGDDDAMVLFEAKESSLGGGMSLHRATEMLLKNCLEGTGFPAYEELENVRIRMVSNDPFDNVNVAIE